MVGFVWNGVDLRLDGRRRRRRRLVCGRRCRRWLLFSMSMGKEGMMEEESLVGAGGAKDGEFGMWEGNRTRLEVELEKELAQLELLDDGVSDYFELEEEEFEEDAEIRVGRIAEMVLGKGEEEARIYAQEIVEELERAKNGYARREERIRTETYVPLHVHSDFSLLDGASQIPFLVSRAKEFGCPALAITDHGVMYGAIELIKECKKQGGIKPIVGNEMYLVNTEYDDRGRSRKKKYHQIVLAKNQVGYRNLVKLTSLSHLEGIHGAGWHRRPCIDKHLLMKYREGLIVTSACLGGEIPQCLLAGRYEEAAHVARWFRDVFEDDFYLELQDHGLAKDRIVNPGLVRIARQEKIKLIVTNDSHFTECQDFRPHDALICINVRMTPIETCDVVRLLTRLPLCLSSLRQTRIITQKIE